MAKIRCVCGEVLTTSGEIPNPIEWLYISDVDYEGFEGEVYAEDVYEQFGHAFVCPRSGHICIFKRGMENEPTAYAPLGEAG